MKSPYFSLGHLEDMLSNYIAENLIKRDERYDISTMPSDNLMRAIQTITAIQIHRKDRITQEHKRRTYEKLLLALDENDD